MRNIVQGGAGPDALIAAIAAGQHGVADTAQLLSAGLSRPGVARRVAAGRLHPVHRGVYAVGHAGLSSRGRWRAATLALGERAVLSHWSAAELWAMLPDRGRIPHVTVPGPGDRSRRRGIAGHRSTSLSPAQTTVCDRIPVTTPARTLDDLARVAPAYLVRRARRQAEYLKLPLGPGHRSDGTRSDLESAFLLRCRRGGLPPPRIGVRIGPYTVDFLWPEQRLVVETDGYAAHAGWQAFQDDHVRDSRLTARGYYVQRFSDWQLTHEPELVMRTLRDLLERLTG